MSTTAEIQAYVRANTATAYSYEGDLHALCDLAGVPAGHLLERLGALLETLPQGVLALLQNGSVEELLPILAPFSPASLFANGEQGVWYDPSDLSTLFQDAAGTMPVTAVGQPVGKILDKSGRGNHATRATTTSRPTLQQDTSGKYYLSFDGVDDWMVMPSIDFTATDKMTVFAGVRKLSDAAGGLVAELSVSRSLNAGAWSLIAPGGVGVRQGYYFSSKGTLDSSNGVDSGFAPPITNVLTGIGDISGDLATLRVNGTQAASRTADQGTGNYGNYPLYIGRRGGTELPFNGRLYGLIVRGAATNATQLEQTEQWINSKMGGIY